MTDRASQFLQEWLQASARGERLLHPQLARDGEAVEWLRVIRMAAQWKLTPLLYFAVVERPWFDAVPVAARLLLEERMARARVIQAALEQELDLVLASAAESRLDLLLLGQSALTTQFSRPTRSDEGIISIGVHDRYEAMRSLAQRGYRGVAFQSDLCVELQHRCSPLRIQVYSDLADDVWRRAVRGLIKNQPYCGIGLTDLTNWFKRELARNEEARNTPRLLLQLALADPNAPELGALGSPASYEKWFGPGFGLAVEKKATWSRQFARVIQHFLLAGSPSQTSEESRYPVQDQEHRHDHGEHRKER